MPEVELVTVPNVEIVTTGEWDASTGPVTFTEDDLRAAVAALDDPAVKSPRLKLGHLDPRFTPDGDSESIFDGTPALGKFVNLRLANEGQSIVADIAGVPKWLADIMPTAYPNRSIEGYWNVKTATGKKHRFVITAVALLGVSGPAVETLEDLPVLFSADGPDGVEIVDGDRVAATRGGRMPQRVEASVQYEDVRRAFYETFAVDDRYWWWIHAVYVDPPVLIVDDDEGHLWRVPYSVSDGNVEFGDPVEVRIQYVETESGNVAASGQAPAKVYATKAESRPESTTEEDSMDPKLIRERLGLAEDASDEEVLSRLDELTAGTPSVEEQPTAKPAPEHAEEDGPEEKSGSEIPEGMTLIDEETLLQLQEQAAEGVAARRQQIEERRKRILDEAIKAGKIPPARREHYAKLLEKDEEGTVALLSSLAPGLVPVDERGGAGTEGQESKDAYPEEWFPEVAARREASSNNGHRKVSIVKEV